MATGYTSGDPGKLDKAGDAMTGLLTLAGPPTQPLHAATKAYVDSSGGGGGGGSPVVVRQAYIKTGDVTPASGAAWLPLPGFELTLPAAVGDRVELAIAGLLQSVGDVFFDLVVLVGSAIVRRSSSGDANPTAADEGDPGLYPNAPGNTFRTSGGPFSFTVVSGDLDGGNVRFALAAKGTGGKAFASAGYPWRWRAINYGPEAS